ncbi:MAG: hypothetical protein NTU44_06035 [Bacteroidetes bacterium]|nr:hypothetical protein [Bacteroidota bacterium]
MTTPSIPSKKRSSFHLGLLFLLFSGFFFQSSYSQDVIIKRNKEELKVKVVTIGEKSVFYRASGDEKGPQYELGKDKIAEIRLENGTIVPIASAPNGFKRNRISLDILDIALGEVALKLERISANGQLGWYLPVAVSYYDGGMYDYDNMVYSGFGLNYYPTGQGTWKYFCGLEMNVGYGTFYHLEQHYYYDPFGYTYYTGNDKDVEGVYTRFLIYNGVIYSPTENFSVDLHLGLGMRNAFIEGLNQDERINPNANIGVCMSFRF